MTGQLLKRKYRIFCLGGPHSSDSECDWEVKADSNDSIWLKRATCPKCGGCTDAIQLR